MPILHRSNNSGCPPATCPSRDGCPPDAVPDFCIRRHDTKPSFRVDVEDCDGPLELTGLVLEANMWALAKLRRTIDAAATYFALADGIGFGQVNVGDVIVVDRARSPEHMLVEGFDEHNSLILVRRGYHGTTPDIWRRGQAMRIFRFMNAPAVTEMTFEDIAQVDGTTLKDQPASSFLVYEWQPQDTCMPGCFWLEFKLIKMKADSLFLPGGYWTDYFNVDDLGNYFTGSVKSTSSVLLALDPHTGHYLLPRNTVWGGPAHVLDGLAYTGTDHDDGSVVLDGTGIASAATVPYDSGIGAISIDPGNEIPDAPAVSCSPASVISTGTVSTISVGFTMVCSDREAPCGIGAGVEWVRRFPVLGEGFLVRVADSGTAELNS